MSTIQDQLIDKIFKSVKIKLKTFRILQNVIVEADFLNFLEISEVFENLIEENRYLRQLQQSIHIRALKLSLHSLKETADNCIERLDKQIEGIDTVDEFEALRKVNVCINNAISCIKDNEAVFTDEIHNYASIYLRNISAIYELHGQKSTVDFHYLCIKNNLKNGKLLLETSNIRQFWKRNLRRLQELVLSRYSYIKEAVAELCCIDMDQLPSTSYTAKNRVREELKKISDTNVKIEDVRKLREEILPPQASLDEQKRIVEAKVDEKEIHLGIQLNSMEWLQKSIKELNLEVARLTEESTRAQDELRRRREKFNEGLIELLRLLKLIEEIEKEISQKIAGFQTNLEEMERKRIEILNNQKLTEEERQELLQTLDNEINQFKVRHASELKLLEQKRDELKNEAMHQAKELQVVSEDLRTQHLEDIEELERRKLGSSPSEILEIEAEIQSKTDEFEQNMKLLETSAEQRQYFYDDIGRYFINEDGSKIYQRDSFSSEYKLDVDGKLIKVGEGIEVEELRDDLGEYYIDKFGEKIYTKKYFVNENEQKYYLDDQGNRILAVELDKVTDGIEQLTNELGEYYVDIFGQKIYKKKYFGDKNEQNRILVEELDQVADGTEQLTDELGEYYVDKFGQKIYSKKYFGCENKKKYYLDDQGNHNPVVELETDDASKEGSECLTEESSDCFLSADEIRLQGNVEYIKNTVGHALRVGLAKVTLHQPQDPIDYLANFLFEYRYNQMRYEESQKEFEELLALRQQIQADGATGTQNDFCEMSRKHSDFL